MFDLEDPLDVARLAEPTPTLSRLGGTVAIDQAPRTGRGHADRSATDHAVIRTALIDLDLDRVVLVRAGHQRHAMSDRMAVVPAAAALLGEGLTG